MKSNITRKKAETLIKHLKKELKPHASKISVVGSVSRKHDTVKDIDLIVTPKKSFSSVISKYDPKGNKFIKFKFRGQPINIWLADKESHDLKAMHFSEGKAIIHKKLDAKKRGLKLTTDGLFYKGNLVTKNPKNIQSLMETPNYRKFINEGQYPRITENYYRFRQADPKFKEYRTVKRHGSLKIYGKNTGDKWQLQSILIKRIDQ